MLSFLTLGDIFFEGNLDQKTFFSALSFTFGPLHADADANDADANYADADAARMCKDKKIPISDLDYFPAKFSDFILNLKKKKKLNQVCIEFPDSTGLANSRIGILYLIAQET